MMEITLAKIRELHKLRDEEEYMKFCENGYLKSLKIKYNRVGYLTHEGYILFASSVNIGNDIMRNRKYQYHIITPKGLITTRDLSMYDSMKECIANIKTIIDRGAYK
jgi:hypothetical protein